MEKNKIIAIVAIAVAVLVLGVFAFTSRKNAPASNDNTQTEQMGEETSDTTSTTEDMATSTTSTVATTTKTTKTTTQPAVKAPGAATLSYTNALKIYSASGYRFQFINGRATPGTMIIKKGSSFMLDNRDGKAHTIKVGTASYHIGAYGFVIATAKTAGTNYIMCDGINTAKIEVE